MADTEKITINMSVVDLGRIDLLVEQGFYSSRTDFIRTAIRDNLKQHQEDVEKIITRNSMALGALIFDAGNLKKFQEKGEKLEINVVGLFMLSDDVSPELAVDVIQSLKVMGTFHAPNEVKAALSEAAIWKPTSRKKRDED